MSKKKNKSINTPNAKAAKNLEALKKAKEAATIEETKAEEQQPVVEEKKEAPIVEKPVEKPTGQPKEQIKVSVTSTPSGKSAYETHELCRKTPFMSPISRALFKDDHNVEQIKETWKNTTDNSTVTIVFPLNKIKPDDNMYTKEDIEKLKESIKEQKKEEPKKEETKPKVEKPKAKKKEEVIEDAEIIDSAPTVQIPNATIPTAPTFNDDRIDANHSVDLMSALMKRREEIKDKPELSELYKASGKQADVMLFTLLTKWNTQWKDDAQAMGIRVNEEMFNYLQNSVSTLLGVKLIGASDHGQLTIDFDKTIKQTTPQIQTALKQEAAVTKKEEPPVDTNACTTDLDKVNAMRTIMAARRNGKGTMGTNLLNAIEFAKKAYSLDEKIEPAQALAIILQKFAEQKQESVLLNCMATAVMGNLTNNLTPVSPHAWMKSQLPALSDQQIADLVTVMLSKRINDEATNEKKDFKNIANGFTKFLHATTDDLINRIVESAKQNGKEDAKLTLPKIKEVATTSSFVSSLKVVNSFKAVYGAEQSDKLMKTKMKQIIALYANKTINPIDVYVEKAYKK